jgi:hypothetical protein
MDQTENKNFGEMASCDEQVDGHRVCHEAGDSTLSSEWTEVDMSETEEIIRFLNSIKRQFFVISSARRKETDNVSSSNSSHTNNFGLSNGHRPVDYTNFERKDDLCFSDSDNSSDQIDSSKYSSSKYSGTISNKSEISFPSLGDKEEGNEIAEDYIDPNLSEKVRNAFIKLRQYQRKILHIVEVIPEVYSRTRRAII